MSAECAPVFCSAAGLWRALAGNSPRAGTNWRLSPHTERAAAKHAELGRALRGGSVVLLQETHWTLAAAAQWGGLFSAAQVAHSVARVGPRGGPQGGVAVVVPFPHKVIGTR